MTLEVGARRPDSLFNQPFFAKAKRSTPGGAADYAASRSLYGPPVITQIDPTLLS
jgi:hypothetical protein